MVKNKSSSFFISLFFISFLLLLLTLGVGGIFYSVQKLEKNISLIIFGNKTEGKITGYESYSSNNSKGSSTKMFSPVIQYQDNKGVLREYHSDYSSSTTENEDEITIYYNPEKPSKAVRAGFLNIFIWPFVILFMAIIALSISLHFGKPIYIEVKKNIFKRNQDKYS